MINKELLERFLDKVDKKTDSECWNWKGCKDRFGYGMMSSKHNKSPFKAHRISYEIHKEVIPKGLWVLHKCDNPSCVNPNHLYLGTQFENMRDASNRGRLSQTSLLNLRPCRKGFHGAGPLSNKEILNA